MTTESKKLQTIEGFTPGPWWAPDKPFGPWGIFQGDTYAGGKLLASVNRPIDARLIAAAPDLYRLAHEQREVIRRLVEAVDALRKDNERLYPAKHGNTAQNLGWEALVAAAPFLQD